MALHMMGLLSLLAHGLLYGVGQGLHLGVGGAVADDEVVGQSGLVCGVEHPDILPFLTIQGFDGRADHFAFCHIDVVLLSILIYHGAWVSAGSSQSGIVGDTLFTAAGLSDGLGSTAGAVLSDGG